MGKRHGDGSCQVRIKETNASEPLRKCRKRRNDVETGRSRWPGINPEGGLCTVWVASGIEVA